MNKKTKTLIRNTLIALMVAIAPVIVQECISKQETAPIVNVSCGK